MPFEVKIPCYVSLIARKSVKLVSIGSQRIQICFWIFDVWRITIVSPDDLFARSRFARTMKSFRPMIENKSFSTK